MSAEKIVEGLWRVLRWPLLALAIFITGHFHGVYETEAEQLQARIKQTEALIESARKLDAMADELERQQLDLERAMRETNLKMNQELQRYAKSHRAVLCLDADGLRLWRAANNGSAPAASGGNVDVPTAAGAGERTLGRSVGQPPGDDGDPPPVPEPPGHSAGVGAADRRASLTLRGGPGGPILISSRGPRHG